MPQVQAQGLWTGPSVVADGQSLNLSPDKPGRWLDLLMLDGSFDLTAVRWFVTADGGEAWQNLDDDLEQRLYHISKRASWSILWLQGGQTNLSLNQNGAAIWALVVAYAQAARNVGLFDRVGYTTIPSSPAFFNASQDQARQDHNELALANAEGAFEAVIDIASLLTHPTDFADGLHLNASGATKVADACRQQTLDWLAEAP